MSAGDSSYSQRLIIGTTTALLLSGIFSYLIRLYARRITHMKLWYDDYLMAVGLVRTEPLPIIKSN